MSTLCHPSWFSAPRIWVSNDRVARIRRRAPQHLIAAPGRKVIQFSLGTSSNSEAKKRREIEDLKWIAHFSELEGRANGQEAHPSPTVQLANAQVLERVAVALGGPA